MEISPRYMNLNTKFGNFDEYHFFYKILLIVKTELGHFETRNHYENIYLERYKL